MWHRDRYASVRNVIVRMDLDNHEAPCKPGNVGREWPAATYDNVTFVWTAAKPYPGTLPAGVRLSTDVGVFENAKTDWLICHAYAHGAVIPGTGFDTCAGDPPPNPPLVTTEFATDVTDTSATLQGTVNPRGSSTSFQFEYGTDTTYGQTTTVTSSSSVVSVKLPSTSGGSSAPSKAIPTAPKAAATVVRCSWDVRPDSACRPPCSAGSR